MNQVSFFCEYLFKPGLESIIKTLWVCYEIGEL